MASYKKTTQESKVLEDFRVHFNITRFINPTELERASEPIIQSRQFLKQHQQRPRKDHYMILVNAKAIPKGDK